MKVNLCKYYYEKNNARVPLEKDKEEEKILEIPYVLQIQTHRPENYSRRHSYDNDSTQLVYT